ncbi:Cas9 inhibitor AcrIIA9 family protein [Carnobacterium maltaromaticum]|uniref:Cas9 inhibitor AcrIIA9 family protein n=1 Tax=Carnobacterium maltaromaticum TaxID=2751 RepID=UPI0039BDBD28
MNELKMKAMEKMLIEMNVKHSGAEDAIHNWLCDQEDELLFEGILKVDRSIRGAVKYCTSQASKQKVGKVAMIDNETVFGWVKKYFMTKTAPKISEKVTAEVVSSDSIPKMEREEKKTFDDKISAIANKRAGTTKEVKSKVEKTNYVSGEQLSLLDML